MSAPATILAALGLFVLLWWVVGVVIFAFLTRVYVHPGAPLSAKLKVVFLIGFTLPYAVVAFGRLPRFVAIAPQGDPDAEKAVQAWMEANCPCDKCRQRRGE